MIYQGASSINPFSAIFGNSLKKRYFSLFFVPFLKISWAILQRIAPLHPINLFIFIYKYLIRVQSWVQVGCNGAILGASFQCVFEFAPVSNPCPASFSFKGCKGAIYKITLASSFAAAAYPIFWGDAIQTRDFVYLPPHNCTGEPIAENTDPSGSGALSARTIFLARPLGSSKPCWNKRNIKNHTILKCDPIPCNEQQSSALYGDSQL